MSYNLNPCPFLNPYQMQKPSYSQILHLQIEPLPIAEPHLIVKPLPLLLIGPLWHALLLCPNSLHHVHFRVCDLLD